MNRKDLEEQGLTKEQIDYVMKENGKDIEAMKDLKVENKNLDTQLKEANEAIKGFKDMDIEGVQKAADDYKQKFEQAEQDAKDQLEKLKFEHKLKEVLGKNKARNTTAVTALLDMEELSFDGKEIKGLDSQLETIKKENDYLFEETEPKKNIPKFMMPGNDGKDKSSGLADIGELAKRASIRK